MRLRVLERATGREAGELEVLPDGRILVLHGTEALRRDVAEWLADGIPLVRGVPTDEPLQVSAVDVSRPGDPFFADHLEGELRCLGYRAFPLEPRETVGPTALEAPSAPDLDGDPTS